MPVTLSIDDAPDDLVRRLEERAARNHRSLRSELLAIIEGAVREPASKPTPRLSIDELAAEVRRVGLSTPDEATAMIRAARDAR
jgi:plasmid stability protein